MRKAGSKRGFENDGNHKTVTVEYLFTEQFLAMTRLTFRKYDFGSVNYEQMSTEFTLVKWEESLVGHMTSRFKATLHELMKHTPMEAACL